MKLSTIITAVASSFAQEVLEDGFERKLTLGNRIDNAQEACSFFMDKAMFCQPPIGKKRKYQFRLDKVIILTPIHAPFSV